MANSMQIIRLTVRRTGEDDYTLLMDWDKEENSIIDKPIRWSERTFDSLTRLMDDILHRFSSPGIAITLETFEDV